MNNVQGAFIWEVLQRMHCGLVRSFTEAVIDNVPVVRIYICKSFRAFIWASYRECTVWFAFTEVVLENVVFG